MPNVLTTDSKNGWDITPPTFGRAGLSNDFLRRAAVNYAGVVSSEPEEATYYQSNTDGTGAFFDGGKAYTLTFPPRGLPDVGEFWSLTMYSTASGGTFNLVPNPIDRYSVGDRTRGLRSNDDGSLTIYIQSTSPGPEKEANWLPSAPSGPFTLTFRAYGPGPDIVAQEWFPPSVEPVK